MKREETSVTIGKGQSSGWVRLKKTVRLVVTGYFDHDVGRNAAALAYYLLFALFPLLLFISNLLGLMALDIVTVTDVLERFLPQDVVLLAEGYLFHVTQNSSPVLFGFSLVFTVWFPMRAANGLMRAVRRAYRLEKPERPFGYAVRQLFYMVVLLSSVALTLFFSTAGEWLVGHLPMIVPALKEMWLIKLLPEIWDLVRFLLLAAVMYTALSLLYALSQDGRRPIRSMLPGAVAALSAWMMLSVGFSFYVENVARYSVIYGALGTVIALLIWLYLTAVILILGAEWNAALQQTRREIAADKMTDSKK